MTSRHTLHCFSHGRVWGIVHYDKRDLVSSGQSAELQREMETNVADVGVVCDGYYACTTANIFSAELDHGGWMEEEVGRWALGGVWADF